MRFDTATSQSTKFDIPPAAAEDILQGPGLPLGCGVPEPGRCAAFVAFASGSRCRAYEYLRFWPERRTRVRVCTAHFGLTNLLLLTPNPRYLYR
jgi:hypothetical protein